MVFKFFLIKKLKVRVFPKTFHCFDPVKAIGVSMRPLLVFVLLGSYFNSFAQDFSDWKIVYEEDGDVINKVDFYDHLNGVAVGNDGLVLVTEDGGENWENYSDVSMGDLFHVDLITKDLFLANSSTEVFKTKDGGENWKKVFSNSSVNVNSVSMTPFLLGADMAFINCDNGIMYSSNSQGDKWFLQNLHGIVSKTDRILHSFGGAYDGFPDSIFQFVTRDLGWVQTLDDFETVDRKENFLDNSKLKVVVDQNAFSEAWFGDDRIYIGEDNKAVYKGGGGVGPLLPVSSNTINCCLWIRRIISSGTNWYGWAIGPNGYISESFGGTTGNYKPITSPTTKDLHWIAWAGKDPGPDTKAFTEATICIVGDGVILQKRVNWDPDPVGLPRISHQVHTEVYPNPFDAYFTVETEGWDKNERIQARLYDINGTLIKDLYNGALPDGSLQLQVVEELQQGVYFMELTSTSKKEVKRLVKN